MTGELRVGTSGWSYEKWHGDFYPEDIPKSKDLEHYTRFFDTVEVNNTFYRLPTEKGLAAWRKRVPADFRFVLKGSRYVTHRKKLIDAAKHVPFLTSRLPALGDKCALLLWQLPPRFGFDADRFRGFLRALPRDPPSAVEVRDERWLVAEARELLVEHGVAFVIHDHQDLTTPAWITSDVVYVRFHGPRGDYHGGYDADALAQWRRRIEGWRGDGKDVWAFFNNDADGKAPWDALALAGRPHARRTIEEWGAAEA